MRTKREIIIKVVCIVFILIAFGIGYLEGYYSKCKPKEIDPISPVEKSRIDTLYLTRDSLIYRTKYIDSIKYDTIEKVYKLDDSSTLHLFLQLVSE